jgi:hypothetical protein
MHDIKNLVGWLWGSESWYFLASARNGGCVISLALCGEKRQLAHGYIKSPLGGEREIEQATKSFSLSSNWLL